MIPANSFNAQSWDELIASLPDPHLLQTWEWAQVKVKYGWQAVPFVWHDPANKPVAAAMVLKRAMPLGGFAKKMCVLYVPKGPLMDWGDATLRQRVLDDLQALAKREGAIFIKSDPDLVLATGIPGADDDAPRPGGQGLRSELEQRGWVFSQDQIQFRNTVMIDLSPTEEEMLARMKQKTRYNIRLAEKKGVTVRAGTVADLPMLYRIYAETSIRDGFVIRAENYYRTVWQTYMQTSVAGCPSSIIPYAEPLIAEVDGQPVAAIFIFYFAGRAYYIYGMSREAHREKMPNHLLQWEAMKRAKAAGCKVYDLWGAPDEFNENAGMWGVFRFKEGLGGHVVRKLGAWDYTPSPMLYKLYTQTLPKVLDIMRSRGKRRTQQALD